jgi:predicted phage terminase large subunit-like protein
MKNNVSRSDVAALLRRDLYSFALQCFKQLNPGTTFVPGWYVELLVNKLEKVHKGRIKRLIINIPPRYLKSLLGSIALPAWWLGHNPSAQIICVSYAQDLADKHSRDCRAVMASPWYRAVFPTRLSRERQAVSEFVTTAHGTRFATSIGGVLTGRGGDLIIVDDPLKPDEALSETQRSFANRWSTNTLLSRLNDKREGAMILIMQRLHEDDLTGHFLAQGGWELLRLPAIAEVNEVFEIGTIIGTQRFARNAGEPLHPAREPLELLQEMRRMMGEYDFAGQYQQSPSPLEGGIIKRAWFPFYKLHELPEPFDLVFQSWDTANKPSELSDFSVCTTWGAKGSHLYLLHVLRRQMGYPELKRSVVEQVSVHNASAVIIEDRASGTQLVQELHGGGLTGIAAYKPEGDKIMRMHAQTATIENGFVHLPSEAPWLDAYLLELLTFPRGRHDDQCDSTAQALHWWRTRQFTPGIFEFYRQEYEKLDRTARR